MFPSTENLYARLRVQGGALLLVHDELEIPPERLLQAIWQHQRLRRDGLQTTSGEKVRVLHPGFMSREGGPDFRNAVVQIGDAPPQSGDIEVDLQSSGWRAHGHDRNPNFRKVILHVIWSGERFSEQSPPALPIARKLDASVSELGLWLNSDASEAMPDSLRGQCSAPLQGLSAPQISTLLHEAAQIRFRAKAAQLQARARQAGWEQALWEGLFRALGYKHNSWPMLCLAEQRGQWMSGRVSPMSLQARLLGLGGLLPSELNRIQAGADGYARKLWDQWWREREEFADCLLPRSLWRLAGQRPANHPQRRLALAAHWLSGGRLADKLGQWCAKKLEDGEIADSLLTVLQVQRDEFWSWHWTIQSPRLAKPHPLLGATRVTDLAVNVILPWLWARATEGKNERLQKAVERRYDLWPSAEDNSVLRLARQRLLGGAPRKNLKSAAEQQGLIQIVRDFCDHSNAVCDNCRFPDLVRQMYAVKTS